MIDNIFYVTVALRYSSYHGIFKAALWQLEGNRGCKWEK